MTIEQAIDDLMDASRSIAEVAESESDEANRINAQNVADDCKQLATWLRELQDRRCEPEVTFCRSCNWNDGTCYCNFHYRNVKPYNYCSWAERRTE